MSQRTKKFLVNAMIAMLARQGSYALTVPYQSVAANCRRLNQRQRRLRVRRGYRDIDY
jgi:hypothetical protein